MVGIDTNVLVRWLTRDNKLLANQADKLLNNAKPASIVLDRIIIAELCYVLRSVYSYKKPHIVTNLKALLNDPRFSIMDRMLVEDMVHIFASNQPLSPEDSFLIAQHNNKKIDEIWSFDKVLLKRI